MRVGIIGAGQLGQMLGFAAKDLGHDCTFLDPADSPPATQCGPVRTAAFDDAEALAALANDVDVITYEFENVPMAALAPIAERVPVYPPLAALQQSQDRLAEKQLFERLDIPLPKYHAVDSCDDLKTAARDIGLPLIVKTRRLGYDGKGQFRLREADAIDSAWASLGAADLIAEQWVPFDGEVSAIAARNPAGDIVHYPLTTNVHRDGILHTSRAPTANPPLEALAKSYIERLLEELDYVGVLALELFVVGDTLLANEFAPRVHNSGHWTIEGMADSQFANHLRAVCGESLPTPAVLGHAGMLNLIGTIPDTARTQKIGQLHDYGKAPRPGRKLGHITVLADCAADCDARLTDLEESVNQSPSPTGPGP